MICVAISDISTKECLALLKNVDMAEIRLDLMQTNDVDMKAIFSSHSKLIATCRTTDLLTDEKRIELLDKAINYGASYVDVEIDSTEHFRKIMTEKVKKSGRKLIVSYHNFEKTPSRDELIHIFNWSLKYNPDIVKIACKSNSLKDNARLLGLLDNDKVQVIVIGMGSIGKVTRIVAPLLGSFCTFASYNKEKITADGQYTFEELKEIYERLSLV